MISKGTLRLEIKWSISGGNRLMAGLGCHLALTAATALLHLGRMEKERILKPKSCLAIYFGSGFTPRIETKTVDLHHQEQLEEGGGSDGTSLVTGMCWQEEGPGDREAV